mmetsp:Transcript_9834/g.17674  ORF Transcript_9834/g.17674 Transcript_9834/m.17674 type:complete len:328 (-) Transcript_9834:1562-2545(-)
MSMSLVCKSAPMEQFTVRNLAAVVGVEDLKQFAHTLSRHVKLQNGEEKTFQLCVGEPSTLIHVSCCKDVEQFLATQLGESSLAVSEQVFHAYSLHPELEFCHRNCTLPATVQLGAQDVQVVLAEPVVNSSKHLQELHLREVAGLQVEHLCQVVQPHSRITQSLRCPHQDVVQASLMVCPHDSLFKLMEYDGAVTVIVQCLEQIVQLLFIQFSTNHLFLQHGFEGRSRHHARSLVVEAARNLPQDALFASTFSPLNSFLQQPQRVLVWRSGQRCLRFRHVASMLPLLLQQVDLVLRQDEGKVQPLDARHDLDFLHLITSRRRPEELEE